MQKSERCALEAVRSFQQAIEHLIRVIWVAYRFDPISPKLIHQSKAQAVVVGNPDRNVFGQMHNAVPDIRIDQF
jgi:hypothetical protein